MIEVHACVEKKKESRFIGQRFVSHARVVELVIAMVETMVKKINLDN